MISGLPTVSALVDDPAPPNAPGSLGRRRPSADVLRFVGRRVSVLGFGLAFLAVVSFTMIRIKPGDPVRAALGDTAPRSAVEAKRAELGFDQPMHQQFIDYVVGLAQFDLGTSIRTGQPAGPLILERLENTTLLALAAAGIVLVIAFGTGTIFGRLTVRGTRRKSEGAFNLLTGVLSAIPDFLMATLLIMVFGLWLAVLPTSGNADLSALVLPALALAIAPGCYLARVVRLSTVNVLQREYIVTAQSKRLPAFTFYLRHVIPNALTVSLTIGGLILGGLVGGSVVVEKVFAWPGVGTLMVDAIVVSDYGIVQGCVVVLGMIVLAINLLVDLVVEIVNPKVAAA